MPSKTPYNKSLLLTVSLDSARSTAAEFNRDASKYQPKRCIH